MRTDVMFSSRTDEWETPQWLFDEWDRLYHFDRDVCATPENAKCKKFYTREDDGLCQTWEGNCWCNPPYGREIGRWVAKAANEIYATTVMLIPARTDTRWFHNYILGKAEIHFLPGRLKFGSSKNGAPFPSMIVVFGKAGI